MSRGPIDRRHYLDQAFSKRERTSSYDADDLVLPVFDSVPFIAPESLYVEYTVDYLTSQAVDAFTGLAVPLSIVPDNEVWEVLRLTTKQNTLIVGSVTGSTIIEVLKRNIAAGVAKELPLDVWNGQGGNGRTVNYTPVSAASASSSCILSLSSLFLRGGDQLLIATYQVVTVATTFNQKWNIEYRKWVRP